jgi:hypothetical protein
MKLLSNSGLGLLVLGGALAAAALPHPAHPAPAAAAMPELAMLHDAAPMRRVAEAFVAHAIAGEAQQASALLSPALRGRAGETAVERVMQAQLLPFFAGGRGLARQTTVTHTTDAEGSTGFAFYMWLAPRDAGQADRPFTVYVVDERGRPVIANVVPDRRVAGRHF